MLIISVLCWKVILLRFLNCEKLDADIVEKRDRLNAENGNAIKSGMANLFGKGKYADMEKENKRLKEERQQGWNRGFHM